jgi:HD-GYP domain-containing protein (c-di-GMP phosphodiesterase class II)
VIPIICAHHEHYDGTGYPDGLRSEQIPPESKIISVCEAYDVMTQKSAYRVPVSDEDALAELKACSGTHFDPHVVGAFASIVQLIQPLNGL